MLKEHINGVVINYWEAGGGGGEEGCDFSGVHLGRAKIFWARI